jgi:hypothetical protein
MTSPASRPWLHRLDAVTARLDAHARPPRPEGLTDPDPQSGERWEAAQVWAHLAEFPGYWTAEVHRILDADPDLGPVPFGRTKADPARIAAIARDRDVEPAQLYTRVRAGLATIAEALSDMQDDDWRRTGRHPTLGVMGLDRIMQEFLVGHLEEHAGQLDGLSRPMT